MFSIPSYEDDSMPHLRHQHLSLSTTSHTPSLEASFSSSKKSDPTNKIDWLNVEHSIMAWFGSKHIARGRPQDFIEQERERQRKTIAHKSSAGEGVKDSVLSRRLGRKLTVSI